MALSVSCDHMFTLRKRNVDCHFSQMAKATEWAREKERGGVLRVNSNELELFGDDVINAPILSLRFLIRQFASECQ